MTKRPDPIRLKDRATDPEAYRRAATKAAKRWLQHQRGGKLRAAQGPIGEKQPLSVLNEGRMNAPQCTAQKRDGTRCRMAVVRGSDRCQFHEGVERNPTCPAAVKRLLAGKLRPPRGRYKTHPSVLRAKAKRQDG